MEEISYPDVKYVRELIAGMNVAGPVKPSNVWTAKTDPEKSGTPRHTISQILPRGAFNDGFACSSFQCVV